MTLLTVQPFTLKDCLMTIATDDYARHLSSVQFVPTVKQPDDITWHGLTPDAEFTDTVPADPTTWVANLGYAQDWETPNSLSRYLLDHEGEEKVAVFEPKRGDGTRFTATITIAPGPIGGDYRTVAVGTVSLKSTEPVPTAIP